MLTLEGETDTEAEKAAEAEPKLYYADDRNILGRVRKLHILGVALATAVPFDGSTSVELEFPTIAPSANFEFADTP